jgi:hypothetical protein
MPKSGISQAKRQQGLLNSGFLDLKGSNRLEFAPISTDELSGTLAELGVEFIQTAGDKLNKLHKVASGALIDSMQPTEVQILDRVLTLQIKVADYYKFVDQGVKGWAGGGEGSPYQFKNYQGKSGQKQSQMVSAIRKWLVKEGLKGKGRENRKPITPREGKRHSITDASTTTAIIISKAIRKHGLRPSHFWQQTTDEIRIKSREYFGKAFKMDIINNLLNTQE